MCMANLPTAVYTCIHTDRNTHGIIAPVKTRLMLSSVETSHLLTYVNAGIKHGHVTQTPNEEGVDERSD